MNKIIDDELTYKIIGCELEDMGMLNAIKKGRTKEYVDTDDFLSELETIG